MAPRGRPRKQRNTRMDGAIDAMIPFGFSEDVVRRTVKDLLKEYGGDEGWAFIEGDAYNVLIETILDEQEKREQEQRKQEKCGEEENLLKDASSQDGRAGDNAIAAAAGPSGASAPTCSEIVDTASQTIETYKYHLPPTEGDGKSRKDIGLDQSCSTKEMVNFSGSGSGNSGYGMYLDNTPFHSPPAIPSPPPVNGFSTRRRKPCYGWISSDDEDDDFIELTPAIPLPKQSENLTGVTDKRGKRKTRWDVRPEDT